MSSKPRHHRNPDPRRRGLGATGTGLGMAVGGAMAAVFVSMSSDLLAPVTHDDAFTELAQTIDPSAVTVDAVPAQAAAEAAVTQLTQTIDPSAVTAAAVTQLTQTIDPSAVTAAAVPAATLDAWEQLVLTIDPTAFDATGSPTDFVGTLANQIDTDLATTVFGPELNTIAGQVSCLMAVPPTCTDLLATVPTTGDNGFTVLEQFLANTYVPEIIPAVLAPSLSSDLASIASQLDAYFAPTVFGPEWFTIASQIVAGL
jgi:hypothetical protein